jgi:hypothetical protein
MARIWFRRRDQPRSVLDEQEALQQQRRALALAYRRTFATPDGQEVLADILRRGQVMQTTFDVDARVAAYNEGRRRMALEIIEMLNADPAQLDRLALTGDTENLFNPPAAPQAREA